MAISETTKKVVSLQKQNLKQKRQANLNDIQAHQDAIAKLEAWNDKLKEEYDALEADIPEPTPPSEVS